MFLIAFCCRFLQVIRNKFASVFSKLAECVFFEKKQRHKEYLITMDASL